MRGCCPSCGSWNTLVEVNDAPAAVKSIISSNGAHAEAIKNIDEKETVRIPTGIGELDVEREAVRRIDKKKENKTKWK